MFNNSAVWILAGLLLIIFVALVIALLQKRDSIDTNIKFLGMNFSFLTKNKQVKDEDDKPKVGSNKGSSKVIIKGTKISDSSVQNIAGKDLTSGSTDLGISSSEVNISDTEIKKSKIESLAGRNIKK